MNDFYKLIELEQTEQMILAKVELNENHAIYDGHFPNQPVVPGVCMIYMIKHIIQRALDNKIVIKKVGSCKFLKMLDPRVNLDLVFEINMDKQSEGDIKIQVNGYSMNEAFIKLKGQIQIS